jgi:signal peptidase I
MDSRVTSEVGFIPAQNLIGRAAFIFFSTEGVGDKCTRDGALALVRMTGCRLIEWPKAIRFSRLFTRIHGL